MAIDKAHEIIKKKTNRPHLKLDIVKHIES